MKAALCVGGPIQFDRLRVVKLPGNTLEWEIMINHRYCRPRKERFIRIRPDIEHPDGGVIFVNVAT